MKTNRIPLLAVLCLVAGCTAASPPASSLAPGASPDRTIGTDPSAPVKPSHVIATQRAPAVTPGTIELPASIVDPIVDEIARLAGVARDQVVVQVAETVTFPNAGLGCPEPGKAYTQVPVDGYRVVVTVGGTTYDVRGTGPGDFRRCS